MPSGNQILTFQYQQEAESTGFNRLLLNLIKPGVAKFTDSSDNEGSIFTTDYKLKPFVAYVESIKAGSTSVTDKVLVRVETTSNTTIDGLTSANQPVYGYIEWNDTTLNVLSFTTTEPTLPHICFGSPDGSVERDIERPLNTNEADSYNVASVSILGVVDKDGNREVYVNGEKACYPNSIASSLGSIDNYVIYERDVNANNGRTAQRTGDSHYILFPKTWEDALATPSISSTSAKTDFEKMADEYYCNCCLDRYGIISFSSSSVDVVQDNYYIGKVEKKDRYQVFYKPFWEGVFNYVNERSYILSGNLSSYMFKNSTTPMSNIFYPNVYYCNGNNLTDALTVATPISYLISNYLCITVENIDGTTKAKLRDVNTVKNRDACLVYTSFRKYVDGDGNTVTYTYWLLNDDMWSKIAHNERIILNKYKVEAVDSPSILRSTVFFTNFGVVEVDDSKKAFIIDPEATTSNDFYKTIGDINYRQYLENKDKWYIYKDTHWVLLKDYSSNVVDCVDTTGSKVRLGGGGKIYLLSLDVRVSGSMSTAHDDPNYNSFSSIEQLKDSLYLHRRESDSGTLLTPYTPCVNTIASCLIQGTYLFAQNDKVFGLTYMDVKRTGSIPYQISLESLLSTASLSASHLDVNLHCCMDKGEIIQDPLTESNTIWNGSFFRPDYATSHSHDVGSIELRIRGSMDDSGYTFIPWTLTFNYLNAAVLSKGDLKPGQCNHLRTNIDLRSIGVNTNPTGAGSDWHDELGRWPIDEDQSCLGGLRIGSFLAGEENGVIDAIGIHAGWKGEINTLLDKAVYFNDRVVEHVSEPEVRISGGEIFSPSAGYDQYHVPVRVSPYEDFINPNVKISQIAPSCSRETIEDENNYWSGLNVNFGGVNLSTTRVVCDSYEDLGIPIAAFEYYDDINHENTCPYLANAVFGHIDHQIFFTPYNLGD